MAVAETAKPGSAGVAALRAKWAEFGIVPLWEGGNNQILDLKSETPRLWRWEDLRPVLIETARTTSPAVVERRVLQLSNPESSGRASDATTGLMNGTLQILLPGETARPHRHSMNALRFILEGEGADTVVDGKPCRMAEGDLVLTPGWSWHEHRHRGDRPVIWLDVLDVSLHVTLGMAAFQPGPIAAEPTVYEDALFGTPGLLPCLEGAAAFPHSPLFRYPWSAVQRALAAAPEAADGSRRLRYVNPMTGGPCMSLIDCAVTELAPGRDTTPFRSSASTICSVVEGHGESQIGGTTIRWQAKDTLTLPQHAWVSHRAEGGPARLFTASNREAYRRLGLLTEETRPQIDATDHEGRAQ